jgi:hypothetical protein
MGAETRPLNLRAAEMLEEAADSADRVAELTTNTQEALDEMVRSGNFRDGAAELRAARSGPCQHTFEEAVLSDDAVAPTVNATVVACSKCGAGPPQAAGLVAKVEAWTLPQLIELAERTRYRWMNGDEPRNLTEAILAALRLVAAPPAVAPRQSADCYRLHGPGPCDVCEPEATRGGEAGADEAFRHHICARLRQWLISVRPDSLTRNESEAMEDIIEDLELRVERGGP